MKVLVNAVAARKGAGAAQLVPFVAGMAAVRPSWTFDVWVTSDFTDRVEHDRVDWHQTDIPAGFHPRRLWWDQVSIPWRTRHADALFSPMNFGPVICPRPQVLLARNILYFDQAARAGAAPATRFANGAQRLLAVASMNAASAVVVPSAAMAATVQRYVRRQSKVSVARHGIELPRTDVEPPTAARRWLEAGERLLFVGSPAPHKDLACVARTFAAVRRRGTGQARLAVTFDRADRTPAVDAFNAVIANHDLGDGVDHLGAVTHDEAMGLYRRASVTLLPSRCESFGLPVAESLLMGTPVVATDLPALREAGGGWGLYHAPGDSDAAADLVYSVLAGEHQVPREDVRAEFAPYSVRREVEAFALAIERAAMHRRRRASAA